MDPLLSTPQHPQVIYKVMEKLDQKGKLDQNHWAFLQKTSKLNAKQAVMQATIHKLSSQLESFHSAKVKKRVQLDPNSKFANIDKIKVAIEEAAAFRAWLQQYQPEIEAQKAAGAALQAAVQECMIEWQAY